MGMQMAMAKAKATKKLNVGIATKKAIKEEIQIAQIKRIRMAKVTIPQQTNHSPSTEFHQSPTRVIPEK